VAKSIARSGLGFDLANDGFSYRCCNVVLRNDDVRLGNIEKWSSEPDVSISIPEIPEDDS
jgi:hypothetical protein